MNFISFSWRLVNLSSSQANNHPSGKRRQLLSEDPRSRIQRRRVPVRDNSTLQQQNELSEFHLQNLQGIVDDESLGDLLPQGVLSGR